MIRKVKSTRKKDFKKSKPVSFFAIIAALLFSLLLFGFIHIYNNNFKPVLKEVASYRAQQLSTLAISNGIIEVLSEHKTKYDDIVSFSKTPDGKITSLSLNLFKINELKSHFTLTINRIINASQKTKIHIPLGNLTGIELFSGLGPMIPVEVAVTGNTFVDFENTFSDSGVNQTRHTVSLKVTSKVSMLMPNNLSASHETVSSVPIAESIIIGDAPENFTILETNLESIKDDILNLN